MKFIYNKKDEKWLKHLFSLGLKRCQVQEPLWAPDDAFKMTWCTLALVAQCKFGIFHKGISSTFSSPIC